MFSQALGLGTSLLGAWGANKRANAALKMEARQFEEMRKLAGYNQFLAATAEEERQGENAYIREMDQLNRLLTEQERAWQIDQLGQGQNILSQERQFEIDRQMEMDREAARMQAMQIEQLLRNQEITADERRYAEQQLEYQRAIAAGEREEDMRNYYEERAISDANRQFLLDQLYMGQDALRSDQARDLAIHDRILDQVGGMQRAMRMAELEMGAVPDIPEISRDELNDLIATRTDQYMGDVDRAADRMASVNEANLIRAGIDASTPGVAARGDVTRRIADEYQSARTRAHDDALAYIMGERDYLMSGYEAQMDRRKDVLAEKMGMEGVGLEQLMRMPQVTSTADGFRMAEASVINPYARQTVSGNSFSDVAGLRTAVFEDDIDYGMSEFRVGNSAYDNGAWGGVGSGVFKPSELYMSDVGAFLGQANNMKQNIYDVARDESANARADMSRAGNLVFGNLTQIAQDYGDTWWESRNKKKEGAGGK